MKNGALKWNYFSLSFGWGMKTSYFLKSTMHIFSSTVNGEDPGSWFLKVTAMYMEDIKRLRLWDGQRIAEKIFSGESSWYYINLIPSSSGKVSEVPPPHFQPNENSINGPFKNRVGRSQWTGAWLWENKRPTASDFGSRQTGAVTKCLACICTKEDHRVFLQHFT